MKLGAVLGRLGVALGVCFELALPRSALAQPNEPPSNEIVVRGERTLSDTLEVSVDSSQARRLPGSAGDPVKVVETLPGGAHLTLGSGEPVLWGSAPEDTRTYVDGVEIPRLFHGSGLRSTINGELIQRVALSPGAYGAEYGRGVGGLVRLETTELDAQELHAVVDANVLDGSALVSAPLGERAQIALGARYGWLGPIVERVGASGFGDFFALPRYRDFQAKSQLALRPDEALSLVFLSSHDELTHTHPDQNPAHARSTTTNNGFSRGYLRYRRSFADGSRTEVVPFIGQDESRFEARSGAAVATIDERSLRWGLRSSHRSQLTSRCSLRLGADIAASHARLFRAGSLTIPGREGDVSVFGQPPGSDTNSDQWNTTAIDLAPYLALGLAWGPLSLTPGVRLDAQLLESSRKTPRIGQTPALGDSRLTARLEPRIKAELALSSRARLLAAGGRYSQAPAASDSSAVFGSPSLPPQTATHLSAGEAVELSASLSLTVLGYYKTLQNLATRDASATPKLAGALVAQGEGRSYGLQILLRLRPWHGFFGFLSYTASRSERRSSPGARFRLFDYDEPHVLSAVASKTLGPWALGLRFRYASGPPRTPVLGAFYDEQDNAFQPIFGPQNATRLPAFWQLDARVDRRFSPNKALRVSLYLELLNVTSHENGEEFAYSSDYARRGLITGLPTLVLAGARLER